MDRSIKVAEGILSKEHDPELSRILTNACVAKGDWKKLPQQIENTWDNRVQLSAQELLQAAQLAQVTGQKQRSEQGLVDLGHPQNTSGKQRN